MIEQKEDKCFEPQSYIRAITECLKYKIGRLYESSNPVRY